jgi:hypothetical protein
MYKLASVLLLLSSSAFAQGSETLKDCPPVAQTAKGELIYSLDCKAIKTDYTVGENKPNMPQTNLKDSVIPKADNAQTPATTTTTGINK